MSTFHLEERRQTRTVIDKLLSDDGGVIDREDQIRQHIYTYYRQLYNDEDLPTDDAFTCNQIISQDCSTNNNCMDEISSDEILDAIKKSASRKSPGPDGIPKEFYLRTFEIIHREFNLILNEPLEGKFPRDFVDGVIVLVRTKRGTGAISCFRPISLLNTDYKLLSRIIKLRLDMIIRKWGIISTAQKCSNKPCNIFQAVLSVMERIVDLKNKRKHGKLVSFDLSQAFDRIKRNFLWRTMSSLGFNPGLV